MTYQLPEEMKKVVAFHGHLCPGLVYGYRIAMEVLRLFDLKAPLGEKITCIAETDSCAVDAFQVLLSTTIGKGNLIIHSWGKSAFTLYNHEIKKAYRFFRTQGYMYRGNFVGEFNRLEQLYQEQKGEKKDRERQQFLKSLDLLARDFNDIFNTQLVSITPPAKAKTAPSIPCASCGIMTMSTKLKKSTEGNSVCTPCLGI